MLLSQLGKVESEDLVPPCTASTCWWWATTCRVLQKGRMIKNTVACYGGEQGQYIGRTDRHARRPKAPQATGDNDVFMLGPEVGERPEVAKLVKAFDDAFNEKLRKVQKERAAEAADKSRRRHGSPDRYLGSELVRALPPARGRAVEDHRARGGVADAGRTARRTSTPECVSCHVVGYQQAGRIPEPRHDAPKLANVQCENCHGMGTMHEAFANPHKTVTEQAVPVHLLTRARTTHTGTSRPKLAMIVHTNK